MEMVLIFIPLLIISFFQSSSPSILPKSPYLGIHPEDEKYYFESQLIQCKDGSKSFTRDRLNDGFCDCVDGTDEPGNVTLNYPLGYTYQSEPNFTELLVKELADEGTPACPRSKFYCKNVGSTPRTLFSSRINDCFCDCCDGSDEYDGSIDCPNTCFKTGNVGRKNHNYMSSRMHMSSFDLQDRENTMNLEDLIQKLKDLKIVFILEVVLVSMVAFYLFCRHIRSRRLPSHKRPKGRFGTRNL